MDPAVAAYLLSELDSVGSSEVIITIDKLFEWVSALDRKDEANSLKGIAFDKTSNNKLGVSGKKDDFAIFIPWGSWDRVGKREFPSELQRAFFDVIKEGKTATAHPFMDLASLVPHEEFFTESWEGKSVAQTIADWVDGYGPETSPVVRVLVGDDAAGNRTTSLDRAPFTNIFWPKNHNGDRVPLVKHPNARIYVGYYNPNFHPKSAESKEIAFIRDWINSMKEIPLLGKYITLTEEDIDALVQALLKGVRTVSWNHGKVLAVNGHVVMTGGGNYWNDYKNKHPWTASDNPDDRMDHDIVDTQAKVVGDAAVSAHRWADYFWKYLRDPADTDDNSTWWGAHLSDNSQKGPAWFAGHEKPANDPQSPLKPPVKDQGKLPNDILKSPVAPAQQSASNAATVLTVAKIGDWKGPSLEINYPVLIVDAVRDILLNIFWQYYANDPDDGLFTRFGNKVWGANKALSDDMMLTTPVVFKDYKINPTAWASRYTRTWAIAYAQSSVIICQQMLVQNLQANEPEYKSLIESINTKVDLKGDKQKWDGHIWPLDMFIAIAQAIGAISQSKEAKSDDNWKGVYIVQTTKHPGKRPSWDDHTSIDRIKFRIRRIMKGLPYQAGGIDDDKIDKAMTDYLHFKRVMKDDGKMFSHSKVVCVDRRLMYVGSDNAYPCYNEEHGIWVEDKEAIDLWLKGFFKRYWAECADPVGEAQFLN